MQILVQPVKGVTQGSAVLTDFWEIPKMLFLRPHWEAHLHNFQVICVQCPWGLVENHCSLRLGDPPALPVAVLLRCTDDRHATVYPRGEWSRPGEIPLRSVSSLWLEHLRPNRQLFPRALRDEVTKGSAQNTSVEVRKFSHPPDILKAEVALSMVTSCRMTE